jgi:hypothetical protein
LIHGVLHPNDVYDASLDCGFEGPRLFHDCAGRLNAAASFAQSLQRHRRS